MRLRRLDLTRYGKFTDKVIDFGDKLDGKPDLHIIYGPNEAGKSTTLSAFLDLLFGIDRTSRYNFLHAYPTMRIGGTLELSGGTRQFSRIKRPHNSLLDAADQPVAENAILGQIGGIDRDAYQAMFSLDDETLEKGGDSILASRGDLGQMLFSASSGLADLSNRLIDVRVATDSFYKFRARSGELAALKDRLAQLRADRDSIDTMASDYAQLVDRCEQTTRLYDDTVEERARLRQRIDDIRRFLAILPRLAGWRAIRTDLEQLAEIRNAPEGWRQDLPELSRQEIELGVRAETVSAAIARIEADIAAITPDEPALQATTRMERLADPRARYITAEKDLPERRMQLREADTVVAGLLARLDRKGEADPARLIIGADTVGHLRDLIENRSGIDAALQAAEQELLDSRESLDRAAAALSKMGGGQDEQAAAMPALAAALSAARAVDFTGRRLMAGKALAAARDEAARKIAALRPWAGDGDGLAAIEVPDAETIGHLRSALAEAEKQIARRSEDVERLTTETLLLEAELGAIARSGGIVTDQQAAEARAERDALWAVHRRSLDAASADAFETALRRDDVVAGSRLAHMADLAGLTAKSQAVATRKAELLRTQTLLDQAETAHRALGDRIAGLIATVSPDLDRTMSLTQLEAWLSKGATALESIQISRSAERDFRDAEADEKNMHDKLATAIEAVGQTVDRDAALETLLVQAQRLVDREAGLAAARNAVEAARRDVEAREQLLARARARDEQWRKAWQQACASCWLGETGKIPALPAVREILALLQDLGPALERRGSLADRIDKMEKDQADFHITVRQLAEDLTIAPSGDVLDRTQEIQARVQQAVTARNALAEADARLRAARAEQSLLEEAITLHARRKAEMTGFFDVLTLDEVGERLVEIDRRNELRKQAAAAEREILDVLQLADMDAAQTVLDAADRPALELELAGLEPRLADLDRRCQELYADKSRASDSLDAVDGDARVAAIEERRRTTLLEIEDGASRYLKLRLGAVAAEHALRLYRDQHRSAMMTRASDAFRIISQGAYSGLATRPDKDKEMLIAVSAAGGSKEATELSKGTRFQLYLALRVAGYHEFAAASGAVPFIADDIMETFDDFRAEEAFRLFAGMAGIGQVIYLTHHQHLCAIARDICPDVHVHEIG